MKKALILTMLLSGLLFYGCGSKGGSAASNSGSSGSPSGGGSQSGPGAVFTLYLVDSVPSIKSGITVTGTPPSPNSVRVAIASYSTSTVAVNTCYYDDNGSVVTDDPSNPYPACLTTPTQVQTQTYKDIQDVNYNNSGSVNLLIPVGTNYTLDVITNVTSTTGHFIVGYGEVTGVNVTSSGGGNGATVTMHPVWQILQMTVADNVISKTKFNVTVNNALPFEPSYTMTMNYNDGVNSAVTTSIRTSSNTCVFTAPTSTVANTTISLQGTFNLNRSFLSTGEASTLWTRNFPGGYGESVSSDLSQLIVVTVPLN